MGSEGLGDFGNFCDIANAVLLRIGSKAAYCDCRVIFSSATQARHSKSESYCTSNDSFGASFRFLENGSWGFASTNSLSKESLEACAARALSLASASPGKSRINPEHVPVHKGRHELGLESGYLDYEPAALLKMAKESAKAMEGSKGIDSASVAVNLVYSRKAVMNNAGLYATESVLRHREFYEAVAKEGADNIQSAHETCGEVGTTAGISRSHELSAQAAARAQKMLTSALPPKGVFDVVIDGELAGTLAHEAVGHSSEGDTVASGGSVLGGMLGKKIASELVTITDSPLEDAYGKYAMDDEGVLASKSTIIDSGVFSGYLTSLESASELGVSPSGNGRAGGFYELPIVRMSNTFIKPGQMELEELFESGNGLYLKGMKGGSVDPVTGNYVFAAEEGFEFSNGDIGRHLRDCTLTGNVLETLKNVAMLSNDFSTSTGMCGKSGQHVPVGDGGPHVRIKGVRLG
ncbi:MAG: TldD/PmbA family protein [Candidatus Micrarchaeia archaeon]